nr:glycosyltransferase family 1 protein [uncultured Brevundimonas sp.]
MGERMVASYIFFDVSDFVYFIGHHDNLTGIQRVQAEIIKNLPYSDTIECHFMSFSHKARTFVGVDYGYLIEVIEDLARPVQSRTVNYDREAARGGVLSRDGAIPPATVPKYNKSVICLLGAAWVQENYALHMHNFRRQYNARFVGLIHDLIPIFAKETCDQGTALVFERFISEFLNYSDAVLTVSQSTKNDLLRYIAQSGSDYTGSITVTRNGGGICRPAEGTVLKQALATSGDFILFVSTIEGRKNHHLAFKALAQILARRGDCPKLICVGRVGWRAEDFLNSCYETDFLNGRIQILQDISDSELSTLYETCKFSIYPSMYEGWGLPVGESLERGKVVIASDSSSIPEVGGPAAVYFESGSVDSLAKAIEANFYDDSVYEKSCAAVLDYIPTTWPEVAERVVAACAQVINEPTRNLYRTLEIGKEYPFRKVPVIDHNLNGDALSDAVMAARAKVLTNGAFRSADYNLGLDVRLGSGWCAPEHWGSWISAKGGDLIYQLDGDVDEVIVQLAYQIVGFAPNVHVKIRASGGGTLNLSNLPQNGVLVIPNVKRIDGMDGSYFSLAISVSASPDTLAAISQADSRLPIIGLKSFVNIKPNDFEARLALLEHALMSGA